MRTWIPVLLAGFVAVTPGQPAAAAPRPALVISSADVPIAADGLRPSPQRFTATCQAGELVSGGFDGLADADGVAVVSSYPSDPSGQPATTGGRPTAWSVVLLNSTESSSYRVQVFAACLTGTSAHTAAAVTTSTGFGSPVTTSCPSTSARTGGGYASAERADLAPAILGSRPLAADQWAVDFLPRTKTPPTVSSYAVCLSGAGATLDGPVETVKYSPADRSCPAPVAARLQCVNQGQQQSTCDSDRATIGGGFRVSGSPSGVFAVTANHPGPHQDWSVAVRGNDDDAAAVTVEVPSVCLSLATDGAPGAGDDNNRGAGPVSAPWNEKAWVAVGGAVLVALLLLILFIALAKARRGRRGRPRPDQRQSTQPVRLRVVVRGQRASYGTCRETP